MSKEITGERCTLPVPLIIRVGVTGHRILEREDMVRQGVKEALAQLDQLLLGTPHSYVAVSPLAEGPDRLVAQKVLAASVSPGMPASALQVVLPLPHKDYAEDFQSVQSRQEFDRLLTQAKTVELIPPLESREAAYEAAGRHVVNHCDVLIAVWDGKPAAGRGGTAETVDYADKVGRSTYIIDPANGSITEKRGADRSLDGLSHLNAFNMEGLAGELVEQQTRAAYRYLSERAASASLPIDCIQRLCDHLLPMFVRADTLAQRYQSLFTAAGSAVYTLAAAAVGIVTIQTLFLPEMPGLIWFEFLAMGLVLFLIWISHRRDWHRKWIDYRFLAERLRTALFLSVAGIECDVPRPPPHLRLSHRPDDWMIRAFQWIWDARPQGPPLPPESFEALKSFLLSAWLQDQINFYVKTSSRHDKRQRRLGKLGWAVFFLALVAAAVHAANIADVILPEGLAGRILVTIAIVFPVIGASAAGIRGQREYVRSAERYRHMAQHLCMSIDDLRQAPDLTTLASVLDQVNQVMLLENQDWRALVLTQELHPA